jgi:hypothetical protein
MGRAAQLLASRGCVLRDVQKKKYANGVGKVAVM